MIRGISYAVGSLAAAGLFLSPVRAAIVGFGNFTNFTINQNDTGSSPTEPTSGALELVTGQGEGRSIFYEMPQDITQFTVSFTFQGTNTDAGGFAFVVENDPRGAAAVSGYDQYAEESGFSGITKSVGVTFDFYDNGTGAYTDGTRGNGEVTIDPPINLNLADPINVQLTYAGSTLTETLTDTVTSKFFSITYPDVTSIPTTVGGSTAFVGITADSGQGEQTFSNFQFTNSAPEPASLSLILTAGTLVMRRRRR